MDKKAFDEILNTDFKTFMLRYQDGHLKETSALISGVLFLPFVDENTRACPKVKDVVRFTQRDWLKCRNVGRKSLSHLSDVYERVGLNFGMTASNIFQDESTESPTLSFQEYINNLKQFADNAGASAIENEVVTDDGYKITMRIQKIK